ncbi:radical SAM protein [Streptomyces sp. SS]|uniref:radical SAM protein n=1 Tax=Streptomyces sp. SS TaxID=260742 RepID=UPI0002FD876F|nr:radical SAM protein [Streptomyces sp. SS]
MTSLEETAPFRTFILKVANRCNIDCDYCYVFNSKDQSWRHLPVRLGADVAREAGRRIGEHATTHGLPAVHVVLHGGEPLLAGRRHLAELLDAVREGVPAEVKVRFELQTNGTLLTQAWLDLFEKYGVVVGVSLDGPPTANDRHRLTHTGRSSSAAAVRGIELLRGRPHLFAGLLAVVDLANDPVEVHDYLASFEPPVIDFGLPHATHDGPPHRDNPNLPEYGLWMSRVYDAWLARPEHRHSIRMLEDIVALSSGVRGAVETLGLAPPTSKPWTRCAPSKRARPGSGSTSFSTPSTRRRVTLSSCTGRTAGPRSPRSARAARWWRSAAAATSRTASAPPTATGTPPSTARTSST